MAPSASGTHGNSSSAKETHGSLNPMASTDPGMVLGHNTNLAAKLETLTNTTNLADLEKDASTFKNFGQFVAAAHVSKNLNIPGEFAALMCEMTTKTAVGATSCANNKKRIALLRLRLACRMPAAPPNRAGSFPCLCGARSAMP